MDKGRGSGAGATERSLGEGSEGARRWRSPAGHPRGEAGGSQRACGRGRRLWPGGQELRKGEGGTFKSTAPIEPRTAGSPQEPTGGDRGGSSERLRASGGRLGPE